MEKDKKKLVIWESMGILFIVTVGTLLHFTYEWSEYSPLVGLFSAVNESVWEHMKMGFGALLLFSLIEIPFIKKDVNNLFFAKAVGLISLQLLNIIVFYIYTAFTGAEILIVDIIVFYISVILCQMLVYRIYLIKKLSKKANIGGAAVILIHAGLLFLFTFYTPHLPIFQETHSGRYGTTWYVDEDFHDDHDH